MRPLIYVRTLTAEEQTTLVQGLQNPQAFTLRRCQIVLARARGERARVIRRTLGV